MNQHLWTSKLKEIAHALSDLSCHCPHCEEIGQDDCDLCKPVWHAGQQLYSYADLVAQVRLPDSLAPPHQPPL